MKNAKTHAIKGFLLGLGLCVAPLTSYAEIFYASGTISTLRFHTSNHPVVQARQHPIFQITGGNLPCTWLFMPSNDTLITSALIAAKGKATAINVAFDSALTSPWGDTAACAVISIDIP